MICAIGFYPFLLAGASGEAFAHRSTDTPPHLKRLFYLFQFVVPEQLHAAVVQEHVHGHVVWGAPASRDRAFLPSQFGSQEGLAHLHPHADQRFFGHHLESSPTGHLTGGACTSGALASHWATRWRRPHPRATLLPGPRRTRRETSSPRPKPTPRAPLVHHGPVHGLGLADSYTDPRTAVLGVPGQNQAQWAARRAAHCARRPGRPSWSARST